VSGVKIIIADSKENSRRILKDTLQHAGYQIQAEARNAPELLRKTRRLFPDLVIIDANLEGGSPEEIAGIIEDDNLSSVLVITDDIHRRSLQEIAHLLKPYTEETLVSVIEVALLYRSKVASIQQEVTRLKENLSNRKLIEKAKGMIMKTQGLTESEAYRYLQKQSMNRAMSMKDLAQEIILSEEKQSIIR
jgi:response regulator NasT